MRTMELTCQRLVELVTDYLENALPDEQQRRFLEHLDACRGCQIHLEQTRTTLRALAASPGDAVSPEVEERLVGLYRRCMPDRLR
jgi:anti-sigma factor RsiW